MLRAATVALFATAFPLLAADIDKERLGRIDAAVEAAIKRGDCPGAVEIGRASCRERV